MAGKGEREIKEGSEIPRSAGDDKPGGKARTLTVVPSTRVIMVGGKGIRVPNAVEVSTEKDLTPELILSGPKKKQIGGQTLSCYLTVDGQRARFDSKGSLV